MLYTLVIYGTYITCKLEHILVRQKAKYLIHVLVLKFFGLYGTVRLLDCQFIFSRSATDQQVNLLLLISNLPLQSQNEARIALQVHN